MLIEKIEFLSGDISIKAKVYRPEKLNNCKGVVIFTHGLGYCDRQYKIDGAYFAEKGYVLFVYNMRGHATTGGEWRLSLAVEDLRNAITFVQSNYVFNNNDRICVLGHSTGALISILAAIDDNRIKFGSVVTVVTSLRDSYKYWFKSGFNQEVKEYFKTKGELPEIIGQFMDDPLMIDKFVNKELDVTTLNIAHRYGMLRSSSWNEFFSEIVYSRDILNEVDRIRIPLIMFRGEYDEVMDVNYTNDLFDALKDRLAAKLFFTKSRNHFHNDSWDMIQEVTLKFFDEFCSPYKNVVDGTKKDILIVDDDDLVTRTLQRLLNRSGFPNVITANSGLKALDEIAILKKEKNKEFDMIISDIRMPGLDGIETVKKIQQAVAETQGRQSSVIFITGYEGDRSELEAKALGYVDYLKKPIDMHRLIESVRKHV